MTQPIWHWAAIVGLLLGVQDGSSSAPRSESSNTTKAPTTLVEARSVEALCNDGSQLKLVLEFDKLELDSPYGKLVIPVTEIRQVEFATRLSPEVVKKIDTAIFNLGSPDFSIRETATRELLALREKSFAAVAAATKHPDLEIAHRAMDVMLKLKASVPEDQLKMREYDIITTTHSAISGKIAVASLKVQSGQFGKQDLQLADVRSLRSMAVDGPVFEPIAIDEDPGSLTGHRDAIGKTLAFKVKGRTDGSVWGTGVYTADSSLATAAVHSGVLKVDEVGIVRVTIVAPPPSFTGSTQNGVTSSPYGIYPGAYQVVTPKASAPVPVAPGAGGAPPATPRGAEGGGIELGPRRLVSPRFEDLPR